MAEPYPQGQIVAGPSASETRRHWLAAYTRARHENRVADQLQAKDVAFLLPTFARKARWSDRIQTVVTPLFSSYVFVNVNEQERRRVLQTAGVISIVSAAGRPSPLSEDDVAMLRRCMERPQRIEPHPYLQVGQRVRVKRGLFTGWQGILVHKGNAARLVVSIDQIMQSVSINLQDDDVEPLSANDLRRPLTFSSNTTLSD